MNKPSIHIFFRVDANPKIGTGHLVRCRILARKLQKAGAKCTFLLKETPKFYEEQLQKQGFGVVFLSPSTAISSQELADLMHKESDSKDILFLTDSDEEIYYTSDFQQQIRNSGIKLMMITFKHEMPFYADIIHNQNLLALEYDYQVASYTKCLLGTKYVIFKEIYEELSVLAAHKRQDNVGTLLINFGGADSTNQTHKALQGVYESDLNFEEIIVVVGRLYAPVEELRGLISRHPSKKTSLYINTSEMPQLQFRADLAITSGGLTAWELACLKTANFIIPTSYREVKSTLLMHQKKLIYYIGEGKDLTSTAIAAQLKSIAVEAENRQKMTHHFYDLVAANGGDFLVEEILGLFEDRT